MHTLCIPVSQEGILRAVQILRQDGLVAFPTETVYGLGGNALSPAAIEAIFEAKGRPGDNPLIAHVADIEEARRYGEWNGTAQVLAEAFWPGPLTLIVKRKELVPDRVSAGLATLALRAPSHPAAQALIKACGFPIAAPSANRSGRPSPTTAKHVMADLDGIIPLVLDGGPSEVGLESTVLDVTGEAPLVLRPGAVTPEMIALIAGECQVAESVMRQLREDESAPSPGMRHKHYAPKARLTLVEGEKDSVKAALTLMAGKLENAWVFALDGLMDKVPDVKVKSLGHDAKDAAHNLFYLLRQADEEGVNRIFVQALPRNGLGLAVMNRLARAAGFDIRQADEILQTHPK